MDQQIQKYYQNNTIHEIGALIIDFSQDFT